MHNTDQDCHREALIKLNFTEVIKRHVDTDINMMTTDQVKSHGGIQASCR